MAGDLGHILAGETGWRLKCRDQNLIQNFVSVVDFSKRRLPHGRGLD